MYERATSQAFANGFHEVIPHPGKATRKVLDPFYDRMQINDGAEVDCFPVTAQVEVSSYTTAMVTIYKMY